MRKRVQYVAVLAVGSVVLGLTGCGQKGMETSPTGAATQPEPDPDARATASKASAQQAGQAQQKALQQAPPQTPQ